MRVDRLARILVIHDLIKAGEPCPVEALAAEMGVSSRTIFRDLSAVRRAQAEVEALVVCCGSLPYAPALARRFRPCYFR